ncbi:MAG: hypothetical protein LBU61_01330 [Coriobacteriales bacterium]|jgi:asparagine synthase (glutamine-hydrolysing)|nr:hypothetical protein [Coriobacteriales bacterium]
MSGIAGYYGVDDLSGSAGHELLQRMGRFQAHRGPDGEGFFQEGTVGFINRRLVISDEVAGDQPKFSADGRYVLNMNGSIFNLAELTAELCETGHSFTSGADAEVVLAAFGEWGNDCFERFNGMWGLAIYDRLEQRLTLSRDHFGIKPLYYALLCGEGQGISNLEIEASSNSQPDDSGDSSLPKPSSKPALLFASELKPLAFSGLIERHPNDKTIYRYLRYRLHDDNAETFFEGINQLLGGEVLEADTAGVRVFKYTTLFDEMVSASHSKDHNIYNPAAAKHYYDLLSESVRQRLRSERPVGSALSGGLDSTSLTTVVSTLMKNDPDSTEAVGEKQKTFSTVFPGSINDEEAYIDAFLKMHGEQVESFKYTPQVDDFVADFDDFIYTMEQPVVSTGPYAQYFMLREVAQQVHVFLTGAGPDEMMAGYVPYYAVYLRQLRARGHYLQMIREGFGSFDKLFRLAWLRFKSQLFGKKAWSDRLFIDPTFAARFTDESYRAVRDNLKLRLFHDLTAYSAPCIARYEDRSAMRFSLEGRLPFVNKDLVRYIWSLSDEALIKGSWNKRMLRDAMLPYLPKVVADRRRKIGFSTPEIEWFGYLKDKFLAIFESESFASRPYFNVGIARQAFRAYYDGKGDATTLSFWRLLHLELWLRMFIDSPLPPTPDEPPHPRGGQLRDMTVDVPPLLGGALDAPPLGGAL